METNREDLIPLTLRSWPEHREFNWFWDLIDR